MTELAPIRVVEAALFSAGKALTEEEIAVATGLSLKEIGPALRALSQEYRDKAAAIEVEKAGAKWAMQIRGGYSDRAKKLAKMEIPGKVLKTLALIAFHQPIRQSDLKDMVGSVVYDHVHELHERGMIGARQDGITKILTTSPRFPEYFGLDAEDRDGLRTLLAKRVGIDPAKLAARKPVDEAPATPASPESNDASEAPAASETSSGDVEALKATTP